jgi:hypothetical protein
MKQATGRIATVVGADSAAIQALLATAAAQWRAAGVKVAGVTAETHGLPDRTCSAGLLRDVVSGTPFPIYLEIPPSDTSCHLDADGVEAACAATRALIPASDLVVLSKFGKLEAMQRGLLPAFEAAMAAGKPVLTTVSEKHRAAWHAFAPDAVLVAADSAAIETWWRAVRVSVRL